MQTYLYLQMLVKLILTGEKAKKNVIDISRHMAESARAIPNKRGEMAIN